MRPASAVPLTTPSPSRAEALAGRRHVAAPGEPQCPDAGCDRPAGFATEHLGAGLCRRHSSHREDAPPTASPRVEPAKAESGASGGPLARRLTGSRAHPSADPLAVMRLLLTTARRAGMPFGEAWALAAEAALSYMSERKAEEWWETLSSTERAWADAYARRDSLLAALHEEHAA